MSERKTFFAEVIIPLAVKNEFTYRVPYELNDILVPGMRVIVPFGRGKLYTGIATRIHEEVPQGYQARYIEHLLDDAPIITGTQYRFWKWISSYYMAPIGDVMNASLPSNFKLASETKVILHPDFNGDTRALNERQLQIVEALEIQEILDLKSISEIVGIKTIQPIIKELIDRKIILSQEELNHRYTPKTAVYYCLDEGFHQEEELHKLLESLERGKQLEKQLEIVLYFAQKMFGKKGAEPYISRKELQEASLSVSAINTLEKKGVLRSERLQIDRLTTNQKELNELKTLSVEQQRALKEIRIEHQSKDICLLHGVTGSGKTEIYVELIREQLEAGKQVLFLLPEIALTTQLIQRLSAYFGDLVGVYHSKFNQNERVEIWNHILNDHPERFRIILGARSSVFLPFKNLGLVIIDEEHESSFKQYDPSPRYHGRDCAIVLAQMQGAKVLMGSATPSVESYYHAKSGKYGLIELKERYQGLQLPEICCADVRKERKRKTMHSHFSSFLLEEINHTLEHGKQVILFQNRRGYTPLWACEVCNWSPKCENCDVSLTYHKHSNRLKCHYCGYTSAPIGTCHHCGSNRLKMIGFGTEKIEDELAILYPDRQVARMDLDSTRSKNAYQEIISQFENRQIDLLIGTQMLSKGLDFDHVGLVGILDADMLLNRPDFRAFERSFQLMTQVAGRAGRKNERGKVIIQTGDPEHWIIQKVIQHDYEGFYTNEIVERRNYFYPPFYKMIQLTLKHKDVDTLNQSAQSLASSLRKVFKERVLGPEFPMIQRINQYYQKQIILKIEREASHTKVKERLTGLIDEFYSVPSNKAVRVVVDVDPA
ncbi:MAG: primosomal protein N' [Bacteroidetes bacterium]|nr:MAG: primosomal protein N' [Bacteroidota bacterium]